MLKRNELLPENQFNALLITMVDRDNVNVVKNMLTSTTVGQRLLKKLGKISISNQNEEILQVLLDKNLNPDSLIHVAVDEPQMFELLICNNANINLKNSFGESPLHLAGKAQNCETIELLLKNGADLQAKNSCGQNVLFFVATPSKPRQYNGTIRLLLKKRAININEKDEKGRFLVHYWCIKDDQWKTANCDTHAVCLMHGLEISAIRFNCACNDDIFTMDCPLINFIATISFINPEYYQTVINHLRIDNEEIYEEVDNLIGKTKKKLIQEIQKMESLAIYPGKNLKSFLLGNRLTATKFLANEDFKQIRNSLDNDFEIQFKIFGEFLNVKNNAAEQRNNLIQNSKFVLDSCVGKHLKAACMYEKIFFYFNANDLREFIVTKDFIK